MDPLHFAIAFCPLGVYLLRLGGLHLRGRTTVIGGNRDFAALALALLGLAIAGPMELFMPETAATQFGPLVWLLMFSFYGLVVTLTLLVSKPKLLIYNVDADELREVMTEVSQMMDSQPLWAGDCLVLPNCGVQLHLEDYPVTRCGALLAINENQSLAAWRQLHVNLCSSFARRPSQRSWLGLSFALAGATLCVVSVLWLAKDPHSTAQNVADLLRL